MIASSDLALSFLPLDFGSLAKPLVLVEGERSLINDLKFRCHTDQLGKYIDPDDRFKLNMSEFRGVGLDRIEHVIKNGIDVVPSDAPFFAGAFDKALEYGGIPKVVMVLDPSCLDRTFREIAADAAPEEISDLKRTFPTEFKSTCGTRLWLTRLGQEDPRAARPYEEEYGRWIPGNPMDALRAVLIFTDSRSTSLESVRAALVAAMIHKTSDC